jgi:hypothetical protein
MVRTVKKTITSLVILALIITLFCVPSCTSKEGQFNFIFQYGYGSKNKNEMNTYKETYTKDMVSDPPIITDMLLTEEEMNEIYRKMEEIDFFNYPDEFFIMIAPGSSRGVVTPYLKYYFKVEYEGVIKELRWDDEIIWRDDQLKDSIDKIIFENKEEAEKLYELISLIREIIENKPEYEELPKPRGGYM